MDKLTHGEKQMVLFSKGHFAQTDNFINDLKQLATHEYALEFDQVDARTLYHYVTKIYFKLTRMGYIRLTPEQFVCDEMFKDLRKPIDYTDVIKRMLSEIAWITPKGLDIGEADPTWMKTSKQEREEKQKKEA